MNEYFKEHIPISKGTLASLCIVVGVFFFAYYTSGFSIGGTGNSCTFGCTIQQNNNGNSNGNTNTNLWPGPTSPVTVPHDYTDLSPILDFEDLVSMITVDPQTLQGPLRISNDGSFPSVIGYEGDTIEVLLGDADQDAVWSDIAIGPDGLPRIVYCSDGSVASPNTIRTVECSSATCEGEVVRGDFAEPTVDASESCSIAVGHDYNPIIAFTDAENNDLYTAKCSNSSCTGTFVYTLHDSAGVTGWNPSVALGAGSLPVISYWDQSNTNLKYAKCNDLNCTSADIDLVDDSGYVGEYSDIQVRSDNRAVIAYSDASNDSVKVAVCQTGGCDPTQLTISIATAILGPNELPVGISLTLDSNDVPLIAYLLANGDVKVAYCYSEYCSPNGASVETIASGQAGTGGIDIELGSDGLPIVVFTDTTDTIRSLHCSDMQCSSVDSDIPVSNNGSNIRSTRMVIGNDGLPIIVHAQTSTRMATIKATTVNFSPLGLSAGVMGSGGEFDPWYLPPLVFGEGSNIGVYGYASDGISKNYGLYGFSLGGTGIYADSQYTSGLPSANFFGPVEIRDAPGVSSPAIADVVIDDRLTARQSIITDSTIFPAVDFNKSIGVPASYIGVSGITSNGGSSEDIFGEELSIGVNAMSQSDDAMQLVGLNYQYGIRGESDDGIGVYGYSFEGPGIYAEVDEVQSDAIGLYGFSANEGIRGESVYQLNGFEFQDPGAGPAVSEQAGVGVLACGTQYAGQFNGSLYFENGFYSEVLNKNYVENGSGEVIARRTDGKVFLNPANLRTIIEQCQLDGGCGSIVLP